MDPQTHWQTIQTELIIKSIEGLLELRLYQKQQFRRTNSSCLNIVMQTMIAECSQIREEIYYNFTFPSSLSFVFSLGDTHIEKWSFLFSSLYE
jgi:DNA-binding transcriptional regulator YiaG